MSKTHEFRKGEAFMFYIKNESTGKQSGRTLPEMLAVLAIAGVLSIIALVGFTYAMNKHKANETIQDVMIRGSNVPMIDENYAMKEPGYEFRFPGMPASGKKGTYYEMMTLKSRGNTYFVEAADVSEAVCKMILKMNPTDIDQIIVDGTVYLGDESICDDGVAMQFCFGDDLCEDVDCGANGEFVDGRCQCVNDFTGFYCEKAPQCNTTEDCDGVRVCSSDKQCVCPEIGEPNECQEFGEANGCSVLIPLPNGTICSEGYCVNGKCGCMTCEEIECDSGQCEKACVLSNEGCAIGCANPEECPEGTQLHKTEDGCYCAPMVCEQGALENRFCCTQESLDRCGEDDSPSKHVWIGAVSGPTETPYCCCSKNESEACCDAAGSETQWNANESNCCVIQKCEYDLSKNPVGKVGAECMVENYVEPHGQVGAECKVENYEDIAGRVAADCWVKDYKEPAGRVEATCVVKGYVDFAPHCYYTDDSGNTKDSGKECAEYICYNSNGESQTRTTNPKNNPCIPSFTDDEWSCSCQKPRHVTTLPELNATKVDGLTGCPDGQYCYLRYTAKDCTGSFSDGGNPTMYGVCMDFDKTNDACRQQVDLAPLNARRIEDGYGCPYGQYCHVRYTAEDCTGSFSDGGSEKMYGVCMDWEDTSKACPQKVHLDPLNPTKLDGETLCPEGQYCYVKYTAEDCTGSFSDGGNPTMYGVCMDWEDTNKGCIQQVHLEPLKPTMMDGTSTCPDGQYCYVQYAQEDCSNGFSDGGNPTMYGVCTDWDSSSVRCPEVVHLDDDYLEQDDFRDCSSGNYCHLLYESSDYSTSISDRTAAGKIYGYCVPLDDETGKCND